MLDGADLTKADLYGAQLQGASLDGAQLQGASLESAELQGASLYSVKLQGASLDRAQLQGASLESAELQGASLDLAELQGASLRGAWLQGASLYIANLQGASLFSAQLQGASLDGAKVNGTNFSGSYLWRTDWGEKGPAKLGAVWLKDPIWKPVWRATFSGAARWDAKAFADLRGSMTSIPEGRMHELALKRIERLACGNPDKKLASCDPAARPPHEVLVWQEKLRAASVDDATFEKALATELRDAVCVNDVDAIHILRGMPLRFPSIFEIFRARSELAETGREAPRLVDFIMSKDCPVSTSLSDDDKAKLLKIKQDAEQKSAPPPTSNKEK